MLRRVRIGHLGDGEFAEVCRRVGLVAAVHRRRAGCEHVVAVHQSEEGCADRVLQGVPLLHPYQPACREIEKGES